MRVLVCGGRDYSSADVWNWLERFGHGEAAEALTGSSYSPKTGTRYRITAIIHGGARGADEGAGAWGKSENIPVQVFPADWKKHGKAAGPIRNRKMIAEGKPDVVIAFPGGRGTADMIATAEASAIPVVKVRF